jgi:hypothetical protein
MYQHKLQVVMVTWQGNVDPWKMPQVLVQGRVLLEVAVTGSLGLQATVQTVMCGPQPSLGFHLVNWEIVADEKTKNSTECSEK